VAALVHLERVLPMRSADLSHTFKILLVEENGADGLLLMNFDDHNR
jgi:hypothetical protein